MRVVGYIRVSTEEQAREGVSLDAQRKRVAGYAEVYGLELAAIVEDAGVSAKTLDRPGLRRVLAMLDNDQVDGMLIAKLDRLTRSVPDWSKLIATYFGEKGSKQLFSVGDSIDTRTAAGRMVLYILMSVAQWEREVICERTVEGLRIKRERGERVGTVPLGLRLSSDGNRVEPDAMELSHLARIAELSGAGVGPREIARQLDREGRPTRSGRPWSHSSVRRILARSLTVAIETPASL